MHSGANFLAYLALFCWPFVGIVLFFVLRPPIALAISILGADLLLPSGLSIKFEMVPAIDKNTVGSLTALVGVIFSLRRIPTPLTSSGFANLLLLGYFVSPFVTSILNGDPIYAADRVLPGVGLYDASSAFISQFILFSPFLVGRQIFRSTRDISDVLLVLVVAGALYSILMLFEVRMSPQLHYWIYGYYPSQFAQAIRGDGFRPMVFVGHGLLASFFLMTCLIAASAFWRLNIRTINLPPGIVAGYLGVVLLLCKSVGAFLYGFTLAPLVRWASPKAQIRVALTLAIIGLTYPVTRAFDLFPSKALVDIASTFSTDRAESLQFRFKNEDELLAKASERFWFGWGRYGRNRVYNEYGDQSVTDGRWIITFGQFGAFGFICEFGLLAIPIFLAIGGLRHVGSRRAAVFFGALVLIQAVRLIDQLPNSSINPWAWLLSGALFGWIEASSHQARCRKMARVDGSSNVRVSSSRMTEA
ncbi:hypothetical protein IVA95_36885 [Bradyrhizobium sp. 157]|uniref:hypothetical protein n=1 Tax=Bradyrhizobium sp. 157 TaxID=2782631 RepID=UPI001FF8C880|nr:hypothetical protein [Bradyrhizobium sp. 157]MCK1642990.1 hypothetical protein [Bradyrhizobium sp. 157]